ncbi:MAG: nucleoside kinase [Oscillospiraceae bacterium]|jgi:uridine kinase|nr:nucleoside kinase [Oscillospiraceae bacterium]
MADCDFYEINRRAREDPAEFVAECDRLYAMHVEAAAVRLTDGVDSSRIVLLSGPSGSGKTTTAKLLRLRLARHGVRSHVISLDDYYRTVDLETHPRDEEGGIDFENPDLLDIPLLTAHFAELAEGREILVPKFDFPNQCRDMSRAVPLRLGANEIAIFEGIHALNPILSGPIGDRARKLYVSARSNILKDGALFFKGTWVRLARRLIRDEKFRGTPATYTLTLWANVRRGEKRYISPFKNSADIIIDSFFPYEVCALRPHALKVFETIPENCPRREELSGIHERLEAFEGLSETHLAHDALLREFIGGGSIEY